MLKQFKEFAMRGNVMDMAVGVVMASAFGAIINGLVDGIINPIIGALTAGVNLANLSVEIFGVKMDYGLFIDAILKFIIIAFALFLVVKAINKVNATIDKEEGKVSKPLLKECPYCKTDIAKDATRCPNCTSELTNKKTL